MRISDQTAAIKLAICDDIGERSYNAADVAAILVQILTKLPSVGTMEMLRSLENLRSTSISLGGTGIYSCTTTSKSNHLYSSLIKNFHVSGCSLFYLLKRYVS